MESSDKYRIDIRLRIENFRILRLNEAKTGDAQRQLYFLTP